MPTATSMSRHGSGTQAVVAVVLQLLLQIHLAVAVMAGLSRSNDHSGAVVAHVAPCRHDQAAALLRIKWSLTATADDSITAFQSWKIGTDCCRWAGVHCGADGRVASLDLGDWGLESAAAAVGDARDDEPRAAGGAVAAPSSGSGGASRGQREIWNRRSLGNRFSPLPSSPQGNLMPGNGNPPEKRP